MRKFPDNGNCPATSPGKSQAGKFALTGICRCAPEIESISAFPSESLMALLFREKVILQLFSE